MAHNKPDPAGLKLRLVAAQRLKSVLSGDNFAPLTAAELADGRDRALANRLITTALRRQGQLNFIIHALLDKGMPGKSGTFEAVLRLSLAQLVFLPDLGAHSALFLAVEAVNMAIWNRRPGRGVIRHCDHGCQYTALAFGRTLRRHGLVGSMGSVGDALDNALAESFFATLQTELLDRCRWPSRQALSSAIFEYIEAF